MGWIIAGILAIMNGLFLRLLQLLRRLQIPHLSLHCVIGTGIFEAEIGLGSTIPTLDNTRLSMKVISS